MLDTVCDTTSLHRKSAVRKFSRIFSTKKFERERRGRPVVYGPDVSAALFDVWEVGARCCAENLHTQVAAYIAARKALDEWEHSETAARLLLKMSLGEMKRRVKESRQKTRTERKGDNPIFHHQKESSGVRRSVEKQRARPPAIRHGGALWDLLKGDLVYTVHGVDPAILWANRRAQWNKAEQATLASVEYIERQMPSDTKSRHSNSGSEFLNYYFLDATRKHASLRRAAELAGRTTMRSLRRGTVTSCASGSGMNDWIRPRTLSRSTRCTRNSTSISITSRRYDAARKRTRRRKYLRVYDKPQTPYARALAHKLISKEQKEKLRITHAALNPVTLLKEIAILKKALFNVNRATKI